MPIFPDAGKWAVFSAMALVLENHADNRLMGTYLYYRRDIIMYVFGHVTAPSLTLGVMVL